MTGQLRIIRTFKKILLPTSRRICLIRRQSEESRLLQTCFYGFGPLEGGPDPDFSKNIPRCALESASSLTAVEFTCDQIISGSAYSAAGSRLARAARLHAGVGTFRGGLGRCPVLAEHYVSPSYRLPPKMLRIPGTLENSCSPASSA